MTFNLTNETLFAGTFILIIVFFIQYMVYVRLKKIITLEISKKTITMKKQQEQQQLIPNNNNNKQLDDETYDVDTPEEDADSYINPDIN